MNVIEMNKTSTWKGWGIPLRQKPIKKWKIEPTLVY